MADSRRGPFSPVEFKPNYQQQGSMFMSADKSKFDNDATKHIRLGNGSFVVNHGLYGGVPALFIEPVEAAGEVGADASEGGLSKTDVVPGGTIITFMNFECAEVLRSEIIAALSSK
jgi:hypothetical protein